MISTKKFYHKGISQGAQDARIAAFIGHMGKIKKALDALQAANEAFQSKVQHYVIPNQELRMLVAAYRNVQKLSKRDLPGKWVFYHLKSFEIALDAYLTNFDMPSRNYGENDLEGITEIIERVSGDIFFQELKAAQRGELW